MQLAGRSSSHRCKKRSTTMSRSRDLVWDKQTVRHTHTQYQYLIQCILKLVLCLCVCVCLSVCPSHTRSREWKVAAPRFLYQREELHLASCTNRFSSRYDTPLERKRLWEFFQGYVLTAVYPRKNFRLRWA